MRAKKKNTAAADRQALRVAFAGRLRTAPPAPPRDVQAELDRLAG